MTEQTEAVEGDGKQEDSAEIETRAKEMGWVPESEFKGDKAKWVDAAIFVKRGDEFVPFLKANNRKLEADNKVLKGEITEVKQLLRDITAGQAKREKAAYEQAKSDLEAKRDDAIEKGDKAEVKKLDKEIDGLEKPQPVKEAKQESDPVTDAWVKDNPWFLKSEEEVRDYVIRRHGKNLNKGMSISDSLAEVKTETEKRFPELFDNPSRSRPSNVEGGGNGRGGGDPKGWDALPDEAKEIGRKLVKNGTYKSNGDYAKAYFA
jgi:hypothetical protein